MIIQPLNFTAADGLTDTADVVTDAGQRIGTIYRTPRRHGHYMIAETTSRQEVYAGHRIAAALEMLKAHAAGVAMRVAA